MSDVNGYDDYSDEVYGDTDPNNLPVNRAGQAAPAGDGLPGYPVDGCPGLRAGVFGAGRGLLGLAHASDLVARQGDAPARLILASDPRSPDPTMPPAYMPNGHGGVQLRPDFAATHPKGPFDFGAMAHNIDWGGVALDLAAIAAGALPLVGARAGDVLKAMPGMGIDVWRELHHDAQHSKPDNQT